MLSALLLTNAATAAQPVLAVSTAQQDVAAVTLSDLAQAASDYRLPLLLVASILVLVMLWAGDVIKPGSLSRAGLRDVKALPGMVWLFCALMVLLSLPLAVGAVAGQEWVDADWLGGGNPEVRSVAVPMVLGSLAGVTVALAMSYIVGRSAPNAGLRPKAADVPIGLGLFVLALPIVLLLNVGAVAAHEAVTGEQLPEGKIAHPTLQLIFDNAGDPWTWAIIAAVIIAIPLIEEVAYRAFLQSAIFKWTGNVWVGIVLTALLFAAMHLGVSGAASADDGGESSGGGGVPWYAAVGIFGLGLACGLAYERTRRIGVPIAMHAAFNALNVILALAQTAGE